jgi:hypothetical protein
MAGKRSFRQYVDQGDILPCIIVDDIIRSGAAIQETVELVRELGAPIIGCGAIVRFTSAPDSVDGVSIKSLVEFEEHFYETARNASSVRRTSGRARGVLKPGGRRQTGRKAGNNHCTRLSARPGSEGYQLAYDLAMQSSPESKTFR